MKNFWNDLPRPFFALAPMEAVTDVVFRHVIAAAAAPDIYFTEFTNAASYFSENGRHSTRGRLAFTDDEQPMVAQIWGSDPEHFEFMAKGLKQQGFAGIDINMGCPAKDVVKTGGGSGLIRTPDLASDIIAHAKASGLPISVKTRLGDVRTDEWEAWLTHILKQDIVNLTIHLRSRKEMSKVPAHYELIPAIKKLRDQIAPQTLLTIKGDIRDRVHGLELVEKYGVDGIMIGRGVFTNPFAFEVTDDIGPLLTSKQSDLRQENKAHTSLHSAKLAALRQSSNGKEVSALFSGQLESASSASKGPMSTPARMAPGGAAPEHVFVEGQKMFGADQATGPESSDLRGNTKGIGNDGSGVRKHQEPYTINRIPTMAEGATDDGSDRKQRLLDLLRLHLDLFDEYSRDLEPRKFEPLKRFFKIYVRDFAGASELRDSLMHAKSTDEVRRLINS